jgi:hypothetical protein
MAMTKGDGVRMANDAIREYQKQADELEAERQEIDVALGEIKAEKMDAAEDLAVGLLPSVHPDVLTQVIHETGALHLQEVSEDLQKERRRKEARVTEINSTQEFLRREMLIHPTTGEYSVKEQEHKEYCDSLHETLKKYDFKQFKYCHKNKLHVQKNHGMFGSFWRFVTMANSREKSAIEVTLRRLKENDLRTVIRQYDADKKTFDFHRKELKQWRLKIQAVEELVTEREECIRWVTNFADEARKRMRLELSNHLLQADFNEIHKVIRPAGKILVARCAAIDKKHEYLKNMRKTVEKEIRDREKRVQSIDRVKRKWQYKPYAPLYGDKSKWLKKVPHIKRGSTLKRVKWIRTMRGNIHGYNKYDKYSHYMDGSEDFLAYDAFSYKAGERMPYEGFTRTVIGEMDHWRRGHNQERADFQYFNGMRRHQSDYGDNWGWDDIEQDEEIDEAQFMPDESYIESELDGADSGQDHDSEEFHEGDESDNYVEISGDDFDESLDDEAAAAMAGLHNEEESFDDES